MTAGRESVQRSRRAALGAASLAAARGTAILLTLVSVPLTLPHLGVERFGVWMTISSVVALITFADLGIGNSLMTAIAEDEGRGDTRAAARHTSSAFAALTVVAAVLGAVFAAVYPLIPWPDLYNVSSAQAGDEAGPATAVLVGCFLLGLPLTMVQKVQLGVQAGLRKGLWDSAGNLAALLGIVIVVALDGSLPALVGAFAGGPLVAALVNSALWFGRVHRATRPRVRLVSRPVAAALMRLGSAYMLLQLAAMVAFFSDALILAQVLGPEAVANYSIAWKLFSVVSVTVGLVFTPLWPAYSEAAARHDSAWVRRTLRRSLLLAVGATGPAALILLGLGPTLIDIWTDSRVDPPFALLAALAAYTVLSAIGVALAMFMNALRIIRLQLVVALLMAATNVVLSVVLAKAIGIEGVVIGTVVSYTLVALIPLGLAVPGILRRLDSAAPAPPPPVGSGVAGTDLASGGA